jgi:16S rRNA (uracil1498-N3)-methyltransferase
VSPIAAPPAAASTYARGPFQAGGVVILDEQEAHHLKVRRVSEGATIRLVDGRGGIATARLAAERGVVAARVVSTAQVPQPPATELLLACGDRDRFLQAVEKATELGATRIVPVLTERAMTVATRFQAVHVEKAALRARESLKQCGAAWMPLVAPPSLLGDALRQTALRAQRLVADPDGGPMPQLREGDAVTWAVGPEGGFTESELASLRSAGFRPVVLGRATLRFDTAAAAALALTAQARLAAHLQGNQG